MKQTLFAILAIFILALPTAAQEGTGTGKGQTKGHAIEIKATATVTALDQKTRMITLKTPDGKEFSGEVSSEVKNLPQVKVGDVLNITYRAAAAVRINPTTAAPGDAAAVQAAKEGEKPGGQATSLRTVKGTVEAVDVKANTVTFKGPKGNSRTIEVQNPEYRAKLKDLKVGDVVEITIAETLILNVEEGAKK